MLLFVLLFGKVFSFSFHQASFYRHHFFLEVFDLALVFSFATNDVLLGLADGLFLVLNVLFFLFDPIGILFQPLGEVRVGVVPVFFLLPQLIYLLFEGVVIGKGFVVAGDGLFQILFEELGFCLLFIHVRFERLAFDLFQLFQLLMVLLNYFVSAFLNSKELPFVLLEDAGVVVYLFFDGVVVGAVGEDGGVEEGAIGRVIYLFGSVVGRLVHSSI